MSIISVLNPKHRWCPRLLTGIVDGDPISTLTDSGWGLKDFVASGAARPTYKTNIVDGHAVARFDGIANVMNQSTAADWAFLHNGSPNTVCIIFKTRAADSNAAYVMLDTQAASTTNTGYTLFIDDRVSFPRNNRIVTLMGNGTATPLLNDTGADDDIVQQATTVVMTQYDESSAMGSGYEYRILCDNFAVRSGTTSQTPSASSPTHALRLGAIATPALFAAIDVVEVIIFDRMVLAGELTLLRQYIDETYPSVLQHRLQSSDFATIRPEGYDAFPGACTRRSDSGPVIVVWRSGSRHESLGDRGQLIQAVTHDGTSIAAIGPVYSTEFDMRDCRLTRIANDHLAMATFKYQLNTASPPLNAVGFLEATTFETNGLPIWGAPTYLLDSFTLWSALSGPITVLANGDWVVPIYGKLTAGTFTSTRMMRRTAGTGAFGSEVVIADGPAVSKQYNECTIVEYSAGNLIAAVRNDTDSRIDFVFSTNSGATWGPVQTGFAGFGSPTLHKDNVTGRLWLVYRQNATEYTRWAYSDNNGTSWTSGNRFDRRLKRYLYAQFAQFDNGETWLIHSWETSLTQAQVNIKKWQNGTAGQAGGIGLLPAPSVGPSTLTGVKNRGIRVS